MADFTEALIPRKPESLHDMLPRLVADGEQLALLQRIVAGWPGRMRTHVQHPVMTEWSRDEGSALAMERVTRRQLVEAVDRQWPGSILFGVRLSWHDGDQGEPLTRAQVLTPTPHPRALYVLAAGYVIPAT